MKSAHKFRIVKISFFLLLSVGSTLGFAQELGEPKELELSYEKELRRAHFFLGGEFVNLTSDTGGIMGLGPRGGFEYGLTERFSLGSNITFTFQATGKSGAFFYSGITGFARYSFSGSMVRSSHVITKKDGSNIYSTRPAAQSRKSLIFGIDQLFLNGLATIYPAVGPTFGGSWGFIFGGQETEFDLRYSMLMANDNPITMLSLGFSVNLGF